MFVFPRTVLFWDSERMFRGRLSAEHSLKDVEWTGEWLASGDYSLILFIRAEERILGKLTMETRTEDKHK